MSVPQDTDPCDLDINHLDPGIRQIVQDLWDNGFDTVDSGDGVSKFTEDHSGHRYQFCPYPHVIMEADTAEEAEAILTDLNTWLEGRSDLNEWKTWSTCSEDIPEIDGIAFEEIKPWWQIILAGPVVPESEAIVRAEWPEDAPPYDGEWDDEEF